MLSDTAAVGKMVDAVESPQENQEQENLISQQTFAGELARLGCP